MPHTLLIADADQTRSAFLAEQLDADGHTIYIAADRATTIAKLAAHAIDVVLLADLQRAPDAPNLLRDLRANQLDKHVHPAQPVITLGATDDLATLRAYDAGSDHHLAADTNYLVLRAVIAIVALRTLDNVTSRHLHVGQLHIDTAALTADIAGQPVALSKREFELLCQLASDPQRVFTKQQLMRTIWGQEATTQSRTLDSHAARLRQRLQAAGGHGLVHNKHGVGYRLQPAD